MSAVPISRRLGSNESQVLRLVRHGNFTIVYNLALCSRKPLAESTVKSALLTLRKIYPLLRMGVFEDGDGVELFREISCELDFQKEAGCWLDLYHALMNTKFDETGPLWRARFIEAETQPTDVGNYDYHLLLSWHHIITDGTSNLTMLNTLMQILDAELDGVEFSDCSEVPLYPPMEDLMPQKDYRWTEVFEVWNKMKQMESMPTSWSRAFSVLHDNPRTTKLIRGGHLDEGTTKNLVQRCKTEGASVNGAVMAAINVAYYNHFKSKGACSTEPLPLRAEVDVSLRRFFEHQNVCGLYMNIAIVPSTANHDDETNFWAAAKCVTSCLHEVVKGPDFATRILTLDKMIDAVDNVLEQQSCPFNHLDYAVSGMGDISSLLPGVYKNFEVSWFHHSTSCQDQGYPFCFFAETFRGKLHFNADAITHHIAQIDAQKIVDDVMNVLRKSVA